MKLSRYEFSALMLWVSLLWLAAAASAQSIQPIYSFTNGPANPYAGLTLGPDGIYYGTTYAGGIDTNGTVFSVTTNGTLTTLFSFPFANGMYPDGANPYAGLTLGPDGNLYGTTSSGGSNGYGTVFQITPQGVFTRLASFANTNGANPHAGLTLGPDGNFYGTTYYGGGILSAGTIFRITPGGTLTRIFSFNAVSYNGSGNYTNANGADPNAALTLGPDGNFYGTTVNGGRYGYGTVFRVTTNGTVTALASFAQTNGANPYSSLTLGPDTNFYGTTANGGTNKLYPNHGTVFRITTNGTLTTLASFAYTNGSTPYAGLTLGLDNNFYGSTYTAGAGGYGTVFQISTNGTLTTLAAFAYPNGANPYAGLTLESNGSFYGTTYKGGSSGYGMVFQITTNGSLTSLASFINANGAVPEAGLTLGPDGNLYGTTYRDGSNGFGTIFRISSNGAFTNLVSLPHDPYGGNPYAGLTLGPDGNFYGTTYYGGNGYGSVFQVSTNGTFTTLANFAGTNGGNPYAGLTLGPDGNFYGTALGGGIYGPYGDYGTVFQVTTNGTLTSLYSFDNTNGANPYGGLTLGPDGNLYGTTSVGGTGNSGTIFQITTNGTFNTLYSFSAGVDSTNADGASPEAGLTLGPDGNLYGTAVFGGPNNDGTVFRITTNGTLTTLASFDTNGAYPEAGLTLGPDGNFYGTTVLGSASGGGGYGTVFRIDTNGTLIALASFEGTNGYQPHGNLTLGPDGNFYGTTYAGGVSDIGVIYRLNLPPSIVTQPSNQVAAAGSTAAFTVALFGTAPFAYQWLSNSTPVADGTNSTFTIPDVTPSSAGNYQVVAANASGSVTSSVATLSLPVAPMITNQPVSKSVRIGGTASFAVGATGTLPLAYHWYFNTNTQLTAGTNAALSFGPVTTNQAGQYQAIVTSPYGSATSSVAGLAVLLQPNCYGISNSGPGSLTLLLASTPGSTNRLWATTNLSLPLSQWQPITTNTAGVTGLFQFTDTNTSDSFAKFYILSSP